MASFSRTALATFAALSLAGCAGAGIAPQQRSAQPNQVHAIAIGTPAPSVVPCGGQAVSCHAHERTDLSPLPPQTDAGAIPGLHPADLQAAYALPSASNGQGAIVAIVVPYHVATAESDLQVYRSKFGLGECSVANHCLTFVPQIGLTRLPQANPGWGAEEAIDLDMVSATCPKCSLVVVNAQDSRVIDVLAALLQAIRMKPAVISNSWSIAEPSNLNGPAFPTTPLDHQGIAIVAGTGDSGAGVGWPASDPSAIAVGGTTLLANPSLPRGWQEQAWNMGGYGCSSIFARPAWQAWPACTTRAVADVAAVADPATGVAIYDSAGQGTGPAALKGGWEVYGGTSVATPIVAGIIALAGNSSQLSTAEYIYDRSTLLNPLPAFGPALQSGLGSPNGTAAF